MARKIRPELSQDNPYYISKHRFYELKHFCLQYPEWKNELSQINYFLDKSYDPTGEIAVKRALLTDKIRLVETAVMLTSDEFYRYLLKAVTEELSYTYLSTVMRIPCCRDLYFQYYRKFFWILSQNKT